MEKVTKDALPRFAASIVDRLPRKDDGATVVALMGDLGAGKTTFVSALAKELGVEDPVQSPTYVLMKKYPLTGAPYRALIHIDAYRLEKPEEFAALRPEQFIRDPHTLVCVEWPERIGGMLPAPDLTLKFSSQDAGEGERYIGVE